MAQASNPEPSLREAHYYLGLTYARLNRKVESDEQLAIATRLEREELDQQRVILKLVDPSQVDSAATTSSDAK